jgi:2-amino-4-hydroxy-6-hydroxymethyldihydropteridine diphosphokinase
MRALQYVIALGSNRRHGRHGAPGRVISAALAELHLPVIARSRVIQTSPVGPSQRRYSNAAAIIATDLSPPALLARLKAVERTFGRRPGQRWGSRAIDLDIILWTGGIWAGEGLSIPHPAFRDRAFVLTPLTEIAPCWQDPLSRLMIRHLKARLDRKRPRP